MDGCENWIIKKAENQIIDAFQLWCWRRFLRVPWTATISNQSILKEINPEYSLEGLMTLQYFGHLMRRAGTFSWCWETVKDFILGGSKITKDGDCSHEIKRRLLLGRKVMTNLDGILKSRDVTLPTKVCLVKALAFPVVMCGCESWTVKKAERQRIDAFQLWCWRRPVRVLWTARRSNQSILMEISPEYSLEGLMLKLKLQTLWPPELKN